VMGEDERRQTFGAAALPSVLWVVMFSILSLYPATALAYVGPGAGLSAIGSLLAVIAAILAAILGFLWYPLKRILRKRRMRRAAEGKSAEHDPVP
jgi:hypothetical protein